MADATQTQTEKKKRRTTRPSTVVAAGKRKRAIARATVSKGTGRYTYNGLAFSAINEPLVREIVSEPLEFVDSTTFDAEVHVQGGGTLGQAQAARTALAKALVAFTQDDSLKSRMLGFDRSLLIDDPRRVEPKKFKGPKARARFTKSYR